MKKCKRIFIIGHPGAGKALVAKTVADKIGWQFINADLGFEMNVGRSMTEIVGNEGEKNFHDCVSEILSSHITKENIVVTTDASIVCSERNREILSSEFVVYLSVSTPIQIERTARKSAPLLLSKDRHTFFDKLHLERDHLYGQLSLLKINSDNGSLEEHVMDIVNVVLGDENKKQAHNSLTLDEKYLIVFHKETHNPVHLTEQQAICLKLIVEGKTSKEIARDMNISYRTVEGHLANIMELLGCTSSKELIALFYKLL